MQHNELIAYITDARASGLDDVVITQTLREHGWQQADIDTAFTATHPHETQTHLPIKKIIIGVAGSVVIVVAIVLLIPTLLGILSKDAAVVDAADLALEPVTIPNEHNAYADLVKAADALSLTKDDERVLREIAMGTNWDQSKAEDLIVRTADAYTHFTNAITKSAFQDPARANPNAVSDAPNPYLAKWRMLAYIGVLQAYGLVHAGALSEGEAAIFIPIVVGQKMLDSQLSLLEYLTALEIKNIGLTGMQAIAKTYPIESQSASLFADTLAKYNDTETGLQRAVRYQYQRSAAMVDAITNGTNADWSQVVEAKNSVYFQPNNTKALFAADAHQALLDIALLCELTPEHIPEAPITGIKAYSTPNAVGKQMHSLASVSFTPVFKKKCESDALFTAVKTTLAEQTVKTDAVE